MDSGATRGAARGVAGGPAPEPIRGAAPGVVRGALRRRLALGAAVLAGAGAFTLAAPVSAQAATGLATAPSTARAHVSPTPRVTAAVTVSACAGREVRTLPFSTGTVHVYRRGGYVCAVTVPDRPGVRRMMLVSVQARGNRPVVDKGRYAYLAGPVAVHAGHRCVRVKGQVGRGSVSSGWILC